jgi:hypothetical protein
MTNRILLMTSCNRIKQTLFALTLDSYVIKKPFHVIIADGSSLGRTWEEEKYAHEYWQDDIFAKNYCSDISLFDTYINLLPNIISYKIIHSSPKMPKQIGEASLLNLGISQACTLIKDPICIKTNGVVMLNYDLFEFVEDQLINNKKEFYLIRRTNAMEQPSTRVFGFRPQKLSAAITNSSWNEWYEYESCTLENHGKVSNWMEFKMMDVLKKYYKNEEIHDTNSEERDILLDGGNMHNYKNLSHYRNLIEDHIKKYKMPLDNPLIKEFMEGGIW